MGINTAFYISDLLSLTLGIIDKKREGYGCHSAF
jgi:hypothetical protein